MVMKEVHDGRTETNLTAVDGAERIAEIARMLGGVTDSAKAHAETLIKESGSPRSLKKN
jgi:DNA repair protein RecN (Recombination protein N)